MADISAVLHALKMNPQSHFIGPLLRLFDIVGQYSDTQHPPARGHDVTILQCRAGMKDNGIVMFIFFLQLVNVTWLTMIASNGFKMYAWMAPIFILIYFLVIIPAVVLA